MLNKIYYFNDYKLARFEPNKIVFKISIPNLNWIRSDKIGLNKV
jgi:hypothetical protein